MTNETRDHFITCHTPAQLALHKKMLTKIQDHCNKFSCHPDIHRLLQLGLQHFPTPPILKTDFPKHLHDIIILQKRIGWKQLYFGRLAIEWLNQQEDYYLSQGLPDKSEDWMIGIIIIIFTSLHERWKLRCNTAHDDSDNKTTQRQMQIRNQAIHLYELQDQLPPHTHHIFSTPIHILLQQPINSVKLWIDCNKQFIRTMLANNKQQLPPLLTHIALLNVLSSHNSSECG